MEKGRPTCAPTPQSSFKNCACATGLQKISPAKTLPNGIIRSKETLKTANEDIWSHLKTPIADNQDLPALECGKGGKIYSYGDVLQGSQKWAETFLSYGRGHNKPPTVAIISPNSVETPIIALGGIRSGSLLLMIQHDLAHDVHVAMLEDSDASIIITDVTQLSAITKLQKALDRRSFKIFVNGLNESDERSVARIFNKQASDTYVQQKIDPDEAAMVFFSSGTTGKPKGILQSHKGILNEMYLSEVTEYLPKIQGGEQTVNVTFSPLAHTAGLLDCLMALDSGSKVIISKQIDLQHTLELARKFKPTFMMLRPHFLDYISKMENASEYMSGVKMIRNVGAALSKATIEKLKEKLGSHLNIKNCYGSTEAGTISYSPFMEECPNLEMLLISNTELRIIDFNTGEDLGPNEHGEILVRSPRLFKGYLNNPEATKEALDPEGWFHTGDAGFYDEDHYVTHLERIKDVISVNGVKIYPIDIEGILIGHPSVLEAGVVDFPDTEGGELSCKGFVVLSNKELAEEKLKHYVNERVKRPEERLNEIVFLDSLPRGPTSKLQRKALREKSQLQYTSIIL